MKYEIDSTKVFNQWFGGLKDVTVKRIIMRWTNFCSPPKNWQQHRAGELQEETMKKWDRKYRKL